jgi:cell division protein FtsQ
MHRGCMTPAAGQGSCWAHLPAGGGCQAPRGARRRPVNFDSRHRGRNRAAAVEGSVSVAARTFSLPRTPSVRLTRPRGPGLKRLLTALAVVVAIAAGWMWLRDSPLVAINQVDIVGASGAQAGAIRAAVHSAAQDMTTLHVRPDAMRKALAPYAIVKDVQVRADFPHRLKVSVIEHQAVGVIVVAGHKTAVAGDGTLLRDTEASGVPVIPLREPPAGTMLQDAKARSAVALLAAAPAALRARVAKVFLGPRGLTARLKVGTPLYFGSGERLAAKWAAATAVLADPTAKGATSLDLRVPERPAAGGLAQISTQEPAGGTPVQDATTTAPTP